MPPLLPTFRANLHVQVEGYADQMMCTGYETTRQHAAHQALCHGTSIIPLGLMAHVECGHETVDVCILALIAAIQRPGHST